VGTKVGITLYVIGEGRYESQNFPNALFNDSQLLWDGANSRSNYLDVSAKIMASNGGRTWLTEFAQKADVVASSQASGLVGETSYCSGGTGGYCSGGQYYSCTYGYGYGPQAPKPDLAGSYYGQCLCKLGTKSFMADASSDAASTDASPGDGAIDDAATSEAGSDGASSEGGGADDAGFSPDGGGSTSCAGFDDMDTVLVGMHSTDIWVTRLRAELPVDALSVGDLLVQASSSQTPVSSQHTTDRFTDPTYSPCGNSGSSSCTATPFTNDLGAWTMLGGAGFLVGAIVRRRRG
jgi:hypothetical protein